MCLILYNDSKKLKCHLYWRHCLHILTFFSVSLLERLHGMTLNSDSQQNIRSKILVNSVKLTITNTVDKKATLWQMITVIFK